MGVLFHGVVMEAVFASIIIFSHSLRKPHYYFVLHFLEWNLLAFTGSLALSPIKIKKKNHHHIYIERIVWRLTALLVNKKKKKRRHQGNNGTTHFMNEWVNGVCHISLSLMLSVPRSGEQAPLVCWQVLRDHDDDCRPLVVLRRSRRRKRSPNLVKSDVYVCMHVRVFSVLDVLPSSSCRMLASKRFLRSIAWWFF